MSSVVLRCPNCGTTQGAEGECQACHEAKVKYFCTNHNPGRWLENIRCSECGSQFGTPAQSPPRPPSRKAVIPATISSSPPKRPDPPTWVGESPGPWGRAIGRAKHRRRYVERPLPAEEAEYTEPRLEELHPVRVFGSLLRLALRLGVFLLFFFLLMSLWLGGSFVQILYF